MKSEDFILLAAVGAGLFFAVKAFKAKAAPAATSTTGAQRIKTSVDNGWQYFTDGTAIAPDGRYFYQEQQVYDPFGMFRDAF